MVDYDNIHPCATGINYKGDGLYEITYRHEIINGKCVVCGEPWAELLNSYVKATSD